LRASVFITCLADIFAPDIGLAMVRVLGKHGVDLDFPTGQTCCGQPAFNSGAWDDSRRVAKRMIEVFSDSEYLISPSGSCTGMVREQFPALFANEPETLAKAQALADRTYEFVEFLVKVLGIEHPEARFDGRLTYHYTCHLRGIGISNEAEQLIQRLDGVTYVPLDQMDQCCGFGGAFAVKQADISGSMVADKVDAIIASEADAVVVNDTGCIMNISGALHRRNVPIPVIHLARILSGEVTHP
jgi:L-lactate dehydrogenase complex protein LldE